MNGQLNKLPIFYIMYLNKRNWIYISIVNPLKTMRKLKGVFIPLKLFYRFGWGIWNYSPAFWCSKPAFIHIISTDVMWKDKYSTPRFENIPYIWIHIWKFNFIWWWSLKNPELSDLDDYWEQALWYLFYYNEYKMNKPDILAASNYWPWEDYKEHKSSWKNKFLR